MLIRIYFYGEFTLIDFNTVNVDSYERFRQIIIEKCPFIKNTSGLKIFFYNSENTRIFIQDVSSLKQFISYVKDNSQKQINLFVIDETFHENELKKLSSCQNDIMDRFKQEDIKSFNNIEKELDAYNSQILNFKNKISLSFENTFHQLLNNKLSSLISIQPLTVKEKQINHSINTICSICKDYPLKGAIYHCQMCNNYYLCHCCYKRFKKEYYGHQKNHPFYKVVYDKTLHINEQKKISKSPSEYIAQEMKKLNYLEGYEVEVLSELKVFLNYLETNKMEGMKIPFKVKNKGNSFNWIVMSPFADQKYNVHKIAYDVSLNLGKNCQAEVEITLPNLWKNKSLGVYYIPLGIRKDNKKYVKGSVVVIEVWIQIDVPDYKEITM